MIAAGQIRCIAAQNLPRGSGTPVSIRNAELRSANRRVLLLLLCFHMVFSAPKLSRADAQEHPDESEIATVYGTAEHTSTVGMTRKITQILLPGSELTGDSPEGRRNPITIRIDAAYPHGDGFRYDLTWSADLPGEFDLADSLRRIDGSSTDDLPQISVSVTSVLEPERLIPNAVELPQGSWVGGYRATVTLFWILWGAGLAAFGFRHLKEKKRNQDQTPADGVCQLQAISELLTQALSGDSFSAEEKLQLEKLIISFWSTQKQLQELPPRELLTTLRDDPDAGPLLAELERWLYDRPTADDRYLRELLDPMQKILSSASLPPDEERGAG